MNTFRSAALIGLSAALAMLRPADALAHNALLTCFDNGDKTVTCEAGYSDGGSAAGQVIRVLQTNNRLILESRFDRDGTYTFTKPDGGFYVEFVGDAAHIATVDGDDLAN